MNIPLTPDIERTLIEQARKLGTTPEQLVLNSLMERFSPRLASGEQPESERKRALAELLRDHSGVLDSREHVPGGAGMSEGTSRAFAVIVTKRHRRRRAE